jgi:hypothetical protein
MSNISRNPRGTAVCPKAFNFYDACHFPHNRGSSGNLSKKVKLFFVCMTGLLWAIKLKTTYADKRIYGAETG